MSCRKSFQSIAMLPFAFPLSFSALCVLFFYLQNFTWLGVPWASVAASLTSFPALTKTASLFGSHFLVLLVFLVNALLAEALYAYRQEKDEELLKFLVLFLDKHFIYGHKCV